MSRLLLTLTLFLAVPAAAQSPCGTAVTVDPGDTLAAIAAACDTDLGTILGANPDIDDPNVIRVGQVIDLPAPDERARVDRRADRARADRPPTDATDRTPARSDDRSRGPAGTSGQTYTVRSGDTLAEIAARFGVSVAAFVDANAVIEDPARLQVGWDLRVPGAPDRREPAPERPGGRVELAVSADAAAPGETVRLRATGFPPFTDVVVGVGPANSEYDVVSRGLRTSPDGALRTTAALPDAADPGEDWVFVVATPDARTKALSAPVAVTQAGRPDRDEPTDDRVVVRGRLTDEGVECPALRAEDGTLYTLAGDTGRFGPGDLVRAEGAVAEMSTCMQGTTLALDRLMALKDGDRADGSLRRVVEVEGTLVRATECPAVRTDDGTLYTLAGGGDRYAPGTRVMVEGVEAEVSYCQEGPTLAVREIEPAR
jgi:LysM repeat protein